MLKSCRNCGRIHDRTYDCGHKTKRIRYTSTSSEAEFRRRNVWKQTSLEIRDRDNNTCQICLSQSDGKTLPMYSYDCLSVHHIFPLVQFPEKALDRLNLITLCSVHHDEAERGIISRDVLLDLARKQEAKAEVWNV